MLTHLNTVSSVTIGDRLSRHIQRPASHPAHPGSSSSKATRSHANTGFAEKRHTAATRLLREGVGIEVVAHLLGHANVTTTSMTYGHLTVEDARRVMEQAGWFTDGQVQL